MNNLLPSLSTPGKSVALLLLAGTGVLLVGVALTDLYVDWAYQGGPLWTTAR